MPIDKPSVRFDRFRTFIMAYFLLVTTLCLSFFGGFVRALHNGDEVHTVAFSDTNVTTMTKAQVVALGADNECGSGRHGFFDVTYTPHFRAHAAHVAPAAAPRTSAALPAAAARVDSTRILNTITHLSEDFQTRFFESKTGVAGAKWILAQYKKLNDERISSAKLFDHKAWPQPSVVVRVDCAPEDCLDDSIVILSGHLDSITAASSYDSDARSPGADDDASGSACVLEAATALLADKSFRPTRAIEFHHYAAEEVGLWGSQAVASAYQARGVHVAAQLQLDMTGYADGLPAFVLDFTDAKLTSHLQTIAEDLSIATTTTKCGYACSDHASWTKAGYPASFLFEAKFEKTSPYIHTKEDLVKNVDVEHAALFSKVAVGFLLSYAS